jgi:hypothetical protein
MFWMKLNVRLPNLLVYFKKCKALNEKLTNRLWRSNHPIGKFQVKN